jgi:hypothetical protein
MFKKQKELELKIKDLYYLVNLLKEEVRVFNLKLTDKEFKEELKAEKNIIEDLKLKAQKEKEERIDKSFQELFNYTEKIATRGYDE